MNKNILVHPVVQLLSFSIILIGGSSFAGPFLFFIIGSSFSGGAYGITGLIAIAFTILSLYKPLHRSFQTTGLLLMWVSLGICFYNMPAENWETTFEQIVPILTVLLFIAVSSMVLLQHFYYGFKRQ